MSRVKPFEKNLGQKERERERRRKQEERQVPKSLRREAAEMEESSVAAACGGATSKSTGGGGGSKCGRWNPTAEQVKVLTELFRAGLRTPTTEQIQRISSHLSVFGKIESKNVFYWFQNHKARERLHHKKRRRGPPYFSSYYPDCTDIFPTLPHDQSARRGAVCSGIGNGSEGGIMQERERETLDLFPASSHEEPSRVGRVERRGDLLLFSAGRDCPQLDLRLSYM